jgi:hypothetical protein
MSISLHICTVDTHVLVKHDEQELARTPLAHLPNANTARMDLTASGAVLFAALGGTKLLNLLENDPHQQLLLHIAKNDHADEVAWEYAQSSFGNFLVTQFACLRVIAKKAPPAQANAPLRLLVVASSPLVEVAPNTHQILPFPNPLNLKEELKILHKGLTDQKVQGVHTEKIAPTAPALRQALLAGQAILHISCHGSEMVGAGGKPEIGLILEDACGAAERLSGARFTALFGRGVVRLVFLSACKSAQTRSAQPSPTPPRHLAITIWHAIWWRTTCPRRQLVLPIQFRIF